MITFNWTISAAERELELDGLADVIKIVHWRYRGTDENGVTAETYGATSIGNPNPQDFTPWDEVTATDVEGWLEVIMRVVPDVEEGTDPKLTQLEQMQITLEANIALLISPKSITGPLYSAPEVEI
tara:strand:+ start:778 stop:1155 length:378 start_codon:yes stop_codon:yes gene_type:complete